jgi:hypothetical protein
MARSCRRRQELGEIADESAGSKAHRRHLDDLAPDQLEPVSLAEDGEAAILGRTPRA